MICRRPLSTWCLRLCGVLSQLAFASSVDAWAAASPGRLPALANDVAVQIQLAYRHEPIERQRRQQQLAAVLESWRGAARQEANDRLLSEWLRQAIRRSMPGSAAPLPPPPEFADGSAVRPPTAGQPRADVPVSDDKSVGDPFRDDPPGRP